MSLPEQALRDRLTVVALADEMSEAGFIKLGLATTNEE